MATIKITIRAPRRKDRSDFHLLNARSPATASLCETLHGPGWLKRDPKPMRERITEWLERFHRLSMEASLAELEEVYRDCPVPDHVQAVELKGRILQKRMEAATSPASPPPINRPG